MAAADSQVLVTLKIQGHEIPLTKDYEVHTSVFDQPCHFHVDLGDEPELLAAVPPNTPFTLSINGREQFEGNTDGNGDRGDASSSTTRIHGRDFLAPLHDGMVEDEQALEDKTPLEMLKIALDAVGVEADIETDNSTFRMQRAGVSVVTLNAKARKDIPTRRRRRSAKCGETWYSVLKREFQHAGLFLWGAPGRKIVLSSPDADQKAVTRLFRSRNGLDPVQGPTLWTGNIKSHEYDNDTSHRFSRCRIFGRGGGNQYGNTVASGVFEDPEMVGWGFKRTKTVKDANVNSNEEADFYARRKIAESRRAGFQLSYSVEGHTFDALTGGTGVWTPDITVDVDDDRLRIHGAMWVEGLIFRGSEQGTTSMVRVLRPSDLVFGSDEFIEEGGGDGPQGEAPDISEILAHFGGR